MALISQLEQLSLDLLQQSLAMRLAVTFGIVIVGAVLARIARRATDIAWRQRISEQDVVKKLQSRDRQPGRAVEHAFLILTLVVALLYLNASAVTALTAQIGAFLPQAMTAILVFLLGVLLVRGLGSLARGTIESLGVREHLETVGVSPRLFDMFLRGIKLFFYLVVAEIAVVQLGVSPQIINNTLMAASYGVVLLLVLLGFFGFKDLIQNYAAGVYLRGSEVLQPGKRVKVSGEAGEVRDISTFATTITTDSGYFLLSPNKRLMNSDILFKRVAADIDTLEDIKNYFVTEESAYQGAAVGEMALAIFGFDITQGDISDELDETDPDPATLQRVLGELTGEEVRTAVVGSDKLTDLTSEFKIWFDNGAMLLPYFDAETLFPASQGDRYVLCVGVEGDELLVVDPTSGDTGGVYYVDSAEMADAMRDAEDGGYIVLAPRGTTAFWRIKNDLIYSSLSLYRQLSKSLEVQLSKILRRGDVLKQIVPEPVEDFVERWARERDRDVTHMWTPSRGDRQIDEFTDDS